MHHLFWFQKVGHAAIVVLGWLLGKLSGRVKQTKQNDARHGKHDIALETDCVTAEQRVTVSSILTVVLLRDAVIPCSMAVVPCDVIEFVLAIRAIKMWVTVKGLGALQKWNRLWNWHFIFWREQTLGINLFLQYIMKAKEPGGCLRTWEMLHLKVRKLAFEICIGWRELFCFHDSCRLPSVEWRNE